VGPGAEKSEATRYSRRTWLLWLAVGVSMGFATLSKYHVLFLFAGVFMFVITNKSQRHWLRHPGPYLAVLITIIMASPVLLWNAHNGWVSFVFQGSRAGASGEHFKLHFDWFFRSIGGQAAFLLPWIWFPIVRQLYISYKLRKQLLAYSFTFWMAILPLVFFTVVTLWSNLQFHFHWQAPGYMMLFIPLGFGIDRCLSATGKGSVLTRRWLNFSVYFTLITIGVLGTHMVTGFWQWYGPKWIVYKLHKDNNDPTIQGIDYTDIKTRFDKEGWTNNPNMFMGTPRWWLTGKVDWALKGAKDITVFNNDPRNLAFMVEPKKLIGKDAIIISDQEQLDVNADAKPFFDSVTQLPDIEIIRSGRVEYKLQVFYGKNFHVPAGKRMDLPLYRQLVGLPPFGN
ncbi:MAG: glycosyltransferase family 39 protein, partial [Mucilaginibacter sp.]